MNKTGKQLLPYLGLLAGVLSLSMSAIFARWAAAPGPVMAFYRMFIATLAVGPLFLRQVSKGQGPQPRWIPLALLGGVLIALDHGTLYTALVQTRVANATLLNNIAPVWVALFAWLWWRRSLRPIFWAGLGVTLLGAVLVFGNSLAINAELFGGDGLAFLSSLFYAAYFLVTQQARRYMATLPYIWLAVASAALVLLGVTMLMGLPLTGYPLTTYLAFLGAGLVSQVTGYFSVGYALGHLPASIVSATMIAQPVLTMLLAIPLAGEALYPIQMLGAVAVLGGIVLVNRR